MEGNAVLFCACRLMTVAPKGGRIGRATLTRFSHRVEFAVTPRLSIVSRYPQARRQAA